MRALLMALILMALAGGDAFAQPAEATADLALGIRQVEEGELETAVVTLGSVVSALSGKQGREKELSVAHLYLSMAHLGLSEWEVAKANMRLAWRTDRALRLDPKQFPPRLLQLYEEIKREDGDATRAPSASTAEPPRANARSRKGHSKAILMAGAGLGGAALTVGILALPCCTNEGDRRTDTFPFTLSRANPNSSVVVGPVRARPGTFTVTLAFSGDYVILACVGTPSACLPMGGRPQTHSFNVPGDFPAGALQASVYFNTNVAQPPGDAAGTVSFTYDPE